MKFLNWKQFLWIVIYATIVVLVRHNIVEMPNWVWWVVAIVFVIVFELLSTRKDKDNE